MHSDVEYNSEYRLGEPNIELYIRSLNIDLEDEYRAIHSKIECFAQHRHRADYRVVRSEFESSADYSLESPI